MTYRAAFAAKNLGSALRQLSKVRPMPRKPGAGPVPADQVIQVHYADEFENMLGMKDMLYLSQLRLEQN